MAESQCRSQSQTDFASSLQPWNLLMLTWQCRFLVLGVWWWRTTHTTSWKKKANPLYRFHFRKFVSPFSFKQRRWTRRFWSNIPRFFVAFSQYLNCKILHGGTLLQPWPNAFGMPKYVNEDYVIPSPKLNEHQKKRSSPEIEVVFCQLVFFVWRTRSFSSDHPALNSRWGDT